MADPKRPVTLPPLPFHWALLAGATAGVTELGVMYPLDGTFCLVDCFLFLILNSNKNIHESKRE
ncbi:hypothetical protein HMI56_007379 [Coelomomyces lativittatus]|nr:hypothetical protein HMI56_007379 [Coelomomyces lativittatus]